VRWSVEGDRLRLEVRDGGGNGTPSPRPSQVSDTEGRGLAIVAAVAVDWGVESTPDGTTVWAVLQR
jgi:serine/threonine-protein kinase RsbW